MVAQQISGKGPRWEPDQPDDVKDDEDMDGNWPTHPRVPIPNGKALESSLKWDQPHPHQPATTTWVRSLGPVTTRIQGLPSYQVVPVTARKALELTVLATNRNKSCWAPAPMESLSLSWWNPCPCRHGIPALATSQTLLLPPAIPSQDMESQENTPGNTQWHVRKEGGGKEGLVRIEILTSFSFRSRSRSRNRDICAQPLDEAHKASGGSKIVFWAHLVSSRQPKKNQGSADHHRAGLKSTSTCSHSTSRPSTGQKYLWTRCSQSSVFPFNHYEIKWSHLGNKMKSKNSKTYAKILKHEVH